MENAANDPKRGATYHLLCKSKKILPNFVLIFIKIKPLNRAIVRRAEVNDTVTA